MTIKLMMGIMLIILGMLNFYSGLLENNPGAVGIGVMCLGYGCWYTMKQMHD